VSTSLDRDCGGEKGMLAGVHEKKEDPRILQTTITEKALLDERQGEGERAPFIVTDASRKGRGQTLRRERT